MALDHEESVCVSRSPTAVKAAFLRKVYFLLTLQQLSIAFVSFALFMTPGVRPFVQHYRSVTWLTFLALTISILCLRHAHHYSTRHLAVTFVLFTTVVAVTLGGEQFCSSGTSIPTNTNWS